MRITIFVTLFCLSSWAQVGLNGQISTQTGFTRTQLERESNSQTLPQLPNNSTVVVMGTTPQNCFKTACKMAGTFGCDDTNEVAGLARACRGNASDECLVQACSSLGPFACDEYKEIVKILVSCGSDEIQKPTGQRVQDSGDRQTMSDF